MKPRGVDAQRFRYSAAAWNYSTEIARKHASSAANQSLMLGRWSFVLGPWPTTNDERPTTDSSFFLLLQSGDHTEVLERGGIAFYFAAVGQLAQQAAHNFSATRLGKRIGKTDV